MVYSATSRYNAAAPSAPVAHTAESHPRVLSPWFILGTSLSSADVRAAKENKLPPSVSTKDVGDAMTSLHDMSGNVLGVLHSFGYVRGLLNAVSFGEKRRLKSIARMAVMGLVPPHVAHRALLQGDSALPLSWRWKLMKARTDVDITAALLHLLTTAMAEEFDVSKTPAPFLHLSAEILRVGGWPLMHMLHHKFYACTRIFAASNRHPRTCLRAMKVTGTSPARATMLSAKSKLKSWWIARKRQSTPDPQRLVSVLVPWA